MDVLERNFNDAYALLEHLLPDADFVALDLEFTGLGRARPSHLDTPSRRYATARDDAESYPPLQFGLVLFRRARPSGAAPRPRWQAIPFNFNLYPRAVYYPEKARFPFLDRSLMLQASTVHFLLGHGFDFMRCFEAGVSWLRPDDAVPFRAHVAMQRRARRAPPRRADPPSPDDAAAVAKVRAAVAEWLAVAPPPDADRRVVKLFELPRGAIPRRLVFDMMRDAFPATLATSVSTHNGVKLRVESLGSTEEANARRDDDESAAVDEVVERAVGFRAVIDLLCESRTTLVVHHGLMDVTKLYANFVAPLPMTVPEFKHAFKSAFPTIVDTRWGLDYLCARDRQVATVLGRDPGSWTRPPVANPHDASLNTNQGTDNAIGPLADGAARASLSAQKTNGSPMPDVTDTPAPNGDSGSGPQPMQIVEPSDAGGLSEAQPDTVSTSVANSTSSPPLRPTVSPLSSSPVQATTSVPSPVGSAARRTGHGETSRNPMEKIDPRKTDTHRKRTNGRGAAAGPAFWGGGGGAGIEELGNIKEALLDHARRVGLGEHVAVDTFVPTELPKEHGKLNGFVIPEGALRWDRVSDRFSFGRYCVDGMRNGFQHEAGFDALETGKLLILLRELGAAAHVTDQMTNKIFLGTCGGFKAIDLDGSDEEHNEWFAREAVVVRGDLPSDGPEHRFRAALRRITEGTAYDAERSEYFTVDKNSFVGVLARREDDVDDETASGAKRRLEDTMEDDSGLGVVVRNAQSAGLTAMRYDRELLASRWKSEEEDEVKRRRID